MSILTGYRPNFCCECGHKIVRLRWFAWTGRRFCDKCFRKFARAHWLRPSLAIVALVLFGVLVGRGIRRAPPPLIIERTASAPAASSTSSSGQSTAQSNTSATSQFAATSQGTTNSQATTANDQIYICGARTKKGTPCSRRVHGLVRCWQHKGAPAMLPPEKLLVKE